MNYLARFDLSGGNWSWHRTAAAGGFNGVPLEPKGATRRFLVGCVFYFRCDRDCGLDWVSDLCLLASLKSAFLNARIGRCFFIPDLDPCPSAARAVGGVNAFRHGLQPKPAGVSEHLRSVGLLERCPGRSAAIADEARRRAGLMKR